MNVILLETDWMNNRIFGLDLQLLVDAGIMAIAMLVLFFFISSLLFNPARAFLKKRQQYIQEQLDNAKRDEKQAKEFKAEYDGKLKQIDKEADALISEARKKALKQETVIINEAKEEAVKMIDRANKDIELEKSKVQDEMKQEIINVASAMAGKIVKFSMDEKTQSKLFDETLREMGDGTWQN
ncbi:F0F1 ATP synthase subunit B [[Clostridium] polysaccharolyticum]|uniref:ATP synthase subunit b n=1 Tax=[Clostridium] polysaccharolyticum TaxID=29364 RepID=A0A1I0BR88_9FIRM|nr:F0F1 ATP synthase subunit B [[Clostridium] polysaccharolyticum]SET09454.1 F-type H+-transporting ATPase subunit b [[Clostridium] polysaccharolyticum]